MSQPPISAEEAIKRYEEYRAEREKSQKEEPIWIRRSAKAPGSAPYVMHELEYVTAIPVDEKTDQRRKALLEKWEPDFEQFEAKHVRGETGNSPKPATVPHATQPLDPAKILTPEQLELIEYRKVGDVLIVKAKNWLGDEAWRSLHEKLYATGFRWISAGKESHWEIRC